MAVKTYMHLTTRFLEGTDDYALPSSGVVWTNACLLTIRATGRGDSLTTEQCLASSQGAVIIQECRLGCVIIIRGTARQG